MATKTAAAANAKLVAATSRVTQLVAEAEEHQAELRKVGSVVSGVIVLLLLLVVVIVIVDVTVVVVVVGGGGGGGEGVLWRADKSVQEATRGGGLA